MKFTRTLKPLKGQFELAPYLCVVFVLLFFMLFGGYLVLPVGTRLELPPGGSRSGTWTGDAFLVVAVDAGEQCYFENQIVPRLGRSQNPISCTGCRTEGTAQALPAGRPLGAL